MTLPSRRIYVVSDIHLGGVYADSGNLEDRGFRISTHVPSFTSFVDTLSRKSTDGPHIELVVNGDFIDFLAERDGDGWVAFTENPETAAGKLEAVVQRDRPLFDAFGRLLHNGHALTILLGNHDIELALPQVRRRFKTLLDINPRHSFQFIFDGEAYAVGDALIEHGNRYDKFNVVDHDGLRRVRSLQSRNQEVEPKHAFKAPPGSHIVADVMNPIKDSYPFIDLLKPETGAAIPMLLALEPGTRAIATRIARLALEAERHRMAGDALPRFGGDISASNGGSDAFGGDIGSGERENGEDPLENVLRESLGKDAEPFLEQLGLGTGVQIGEDISAAETIDRTWGLVKLLFGSNQNRVEQRLPSLLKALQAVRNDQSFDRAMENPEYGKPAEALARRGYRCIVFGHTHLPKQVELAGGATYINTGTWADFMRFPTELITGNEVQAFPKLREFVDDLKNARLSRWVGFEPTYARLEFDDSDGLLEAKLCDFRGQEDP